MKTFAVVPSNPPGLDGADVRLPLSKTSGRTFLDLFVEIQGTRQVHLQTQASNVDNHAGMLN